MKTAIIWKNPSKDQATRAIVNVEISADLTLYGVRIVKAQGKLFAAAQEVERQGKYYSTAFISKDLSKQIVESVKNDAKKKADEDDDLPF